jgi:predicted DNA-binding protein
MAVVLTGSQRGERRMPKKPRDDKPSDTKPSDGKQINFRASLPLAERLDRTASRLGLDVSNLVRMILIKHLPDYEAEADEIEAKQKKGGE